MAIDWNLQPICAWCGIESPTRELMTLHAGLCAKSPLVARIAELEAALAKVTGLVTDIDCDIGVVLSSEHADAREACATHIVELCGEALAAAREVSK